NVIRLAEANVARLIEENRLVEIPAQISLCGPALRALAKNSPSPEARASLPDTLARGAAAINAIVVAGKINDRPATEHSFAAFKNAMQDAARLFPAQDVNAQISVCPMHPDCLSSNPATPCTKCGMHLVVRRIPYSFVYTRPGEPTVTVTATADAPLEAGKKAEVVIQLKTRDGKPVVAGDLEVMHTQPIHLLIVDPTLQDYHHEHPTPGTTPGTYSFSFTPRRSVPYRIFADIVPVVTGAQEYPFVDLPGAGKSPAVTPADGTFTATAGGLSFKLTFPSVPSGTPRAGQAHNMVVAVTDAQGQPVKRLEPVMNAFAHMVGFYEDYLTVVHLHPTGEDILRDDVRGGPEMAFRFFPPKAGFIRLYCQVQVDGKMIFAPFDVNIVP
ncbi:MAG TPA: hypothetical protein VK968_15455, partial [Roseimicrobium sp.]|nr:hypothetical protein [Roseimicrobium sp.]